MAKNRNKKRSALNNAQKPNEKKESTISDAIQQEVLNDLIECSGCADIGVHLSKKKRKKWQQIEYYVENLPAVEYVVEAFINYIFSDDLATGKAEDKDKLNEFLYRKNLEEVTNYDVLKTVISNALKYGECGLRWYEDNLYAVKRGRYAPLYLREDGIKKHMAWIVAKKDEYVSDFKLEKDQIQTRADLIAQFDRNNTMLLDKSEFVSIMLNHDGVDGIHAKSPFESDKLRLELLAKTYERLNYDVEYDGPGRIIIRPKSGYATSEDGNEVSTSTVLNNSMQAQEDRAKKAKAERDRVAKEIKGSSSDAVILLSDAFDEKITHLPRVTKATEFFGWMDGDVRIVCQVLKIDPYLVGMGKELGNNSSEKIIDNGMLNSIIPLRKKFATQFSKLLSDHLGFEKVYFDFYKMVQQETDTDKLDKYVNMMYKILIGIEKTSGTNVGNEEGTKNKKSGKAMSAVDALYDTALSINELVRNSLYDESGKIKKIDEV